MTLSGEQGCKIKYELPLINAYAVKIESGKLEDTARSDIVNIYPTMSR